MKMLFVLISLMLSNNVMACNMMRDNCANDILPELKKHFDTLVANPKWRKEHDKADVTSIIHYQTHLEMCTTYKCSNDILTEYNNLMRSLVKKYR